MKEMSEQAFRSCISQGFRDKLCKHLRVGSISPPWDVILIARASESVSDVFHRIIENSIMSMPLYDEDRMRYVAFIDVFDILIYIMEVLGASMDKLQGWLIKKEFSETPCSVLPNQSARNPWALIHGDSSLQNCINAMQDSNLSRIGVVDKSGNLSSVLTQSRIVEYLADNVMEVGELAEMTISELGLVKRNRQIISVLQEDPVIQAFIKIYRFNISGVVVLNKEGEMVGDVNIGDLKSVGHSLDLFGRLYISSKDFVEEKYKTKSSTLVWVVESSRLREVLDRFKRYRVHRVYVVDPETKVPYGVVSTREILSLFASDVKKRQTRMAGGYMKVSFQDDADNSSEESPVMSIPVVCESEITEGEWAEEVSSSR